MAAAWNDGDAMVEGAGYGGEALAGRRPVLMDATSGTATCPRWATATAAGARQGELDTVQTRIGQVLEEQVQMAQAFDSAR